jgi:DNA polymerase-3 subunit gamma/tau
MVTPQGFNALLKIVEEPPEHVKFIFATTEPEKVIGTIRSRTHHYPFRLVPPAQMLEYVQSLCEAESVSAEPGVLPLVVRAGGGSVRDTLSLLDQLIAGSEGLKVEYERAVALLGYTHGALLDEVVDAIGANDASAVFAGVDRVIQTGQDPRRFVEDLLERLRDLIIVAATADRAAAVLRGIPHDQLERMSKQAAVFGQAELSRAADVVNAALTEMTGATSPRLHLELMVARILVPASDATERGALARVERLERRIGVSTEATTGAAAPAPRAAAAPAAAQPPAPQSAAPAAEAPAPSVPSPAAVTPVVVEEQLVEEVKSGEATGPAVPPVEVPEAKALAANGDLTLQQLRDAWPEILEVVQKAKLNAWVVLQTAQARALTGDVLTVTFVSENDAANFKQPNPGGDSVSEYLRTAIVEVLGLRVKFIARVEAAPNELAAPVDAEPPAEGGWAVVQIPESEPAKRTPAQRAEAKLEARLAEAKSGPIAPPVTNARYGESVVRELLSASFIEEQPLAPRVVPTPRDE